jgi:hypothetical protein
VPVVPIPGWVRFPIAIALIVWGARTDRPWTLPIACGIASFALYEWSFLTIWLGVFAFAGPWAPQDADGKPLLMRRREIRLPDWLGRRLDRSASPGVDLR